MRPCNEGVSSINAVTKAGSKVTCGFVRAKALWPLSST